MQNCPGCGADVVSGAEYCYECREPIPAKHSVAETEDDDWLDDDLDDVAATPRADVASLDAAGPRDNGGNGSHEAIPEATVVAFEAQDEVQAGTIAQLLSDCGINNYASSQTPDADDGAHATKSLQVQVMAEDLDAARTIIADFTAMCEESED